MDGAVSLLWQIDSINVYCITDLSLYIYEHTDQIDGIRARLYREPISSDKTYQYSNRVNITFPIIVEKRKGKTFFFFLLKRFALYVVNRIGLSFSNWSEKSEEDLLYKKCERNSNSCCCCIYKYCCGFPLLSSVEKDDAKKKWKLFWFILYPFLIYTTCTRAAESRAESFPSDVKSWSMRSKKVQQHPGIRWIWILSQVL